MATFSQLPSGKWRAQVRRAGIYRAATFNLKREAEKWAAGVESQTQHVAAGQLMPVPTGSTVRELIDKYVETGAGYGGKTKQATLQMLKREIGNVRLANLNPLVLRDFIDRRVHAGAGGVTIAADLSFLSAVLKWARGARQLDVDDTLALAARKSLKYRKLNTRSGERTREPSDDELARLYAYWQSRPRMRLDMTLLCRLALATGMRQDELCRIQLEDVDRNARTVVIRDRKDPKLKAGNNQTVPLLPEAWKLIEPLIESRTEDRAEGQRILGAVAASVSAAFTRACKACDIKDLHFHDLRHRATAEFFRMGLDIPRVALLTGHKTWAMLRRYTDIKPADVHSAVERHATTANAATAIFNAARGADGGKTIRRSGERRL